jgi:hypothetical protein
MSPQDNNNETADDAAARTPASTPPFDVEARLARVDFAALAELEERVVEEILDAIDLDRLIEIESVLWLELGELLQRGKLPGVAADDFAVHGQLAISLVARGLRRIADAPERWDTFSDDDCGLCRMLLAEGTRPPST